MKNTLITIFILFSSSLFLVGCEKELPEDAVYDPRYEETDAVCSQAKELLQEVDFIFMRNNSLVELYTQTTDDKNISLVPHFENIPENLSATYNVIRNRDGNVMYVAEFPYGESGDWENIYESVFNDKGDLILFVRKSSFLYSDSINTDIVVFEKSEYYYNSNHKLLKKTYEIKFADQTGIPQGVKIDYAYRFPYEKYKTRKKWLRAHGLEK